MPISARPTPLSLHPSGEAVEPLEAPAQTEPTRTLSDFPPPLGGYEVHAPQPKDDHMADGSDASDGKAYELDKAGRRHPLDKYG